MSDNEEISKESLDFKEKSSKSANIINKTKKEKNKKHKSESIKIIDDYLIKDTIGKGTFSTVKLGEHIKTKQKVAIKILNKEKIKAKEDSIRIKREFKILSMMDHPNIIKTYKISENEKSYFIIMEYCDGGELFNYIVEKEKLDQNEASMFFFQLISALEYIHSLGIAHRDLKPENLLLVENKIIKIIDFGLSNYFNGEKNLETPCGSPSYASPEIIKGEAYNGFSIDIWASGIIMFAMLCGYLPFDDDDDEENEEESNEENSSEGNNNKHNNKNNNSSNESEESEDNEILFQKILEGKLEFPSYLSPEAVDLMKKILVVDPNKRIQIKDIKKHKFFLLGQKNYFLNQKNIIKKKKISKNIKIEKLNNNENDENEYLNNISKDIIHSIMNNNDDYEKKSSNSISNTKINESNSNNNTLIEVNKSEDIEKNDKNDKNKDNIIKNDMEEYEKKLFENYLRNVSAIRKRNSLINKKKKQCNENNKKNNKNQIFSNALTIKANPMRSYFQKNERKMIKNKNNFTLNEIVLDFKGNNTESYKEITNSKSRKLNNNYNYNYTPITKINPIRRKNYDFFIKNNNIFNQKENNKNTNRDSHSLITTNIPNDLSSKRRNNTEDKILNDLKYCITNGNYKKMEDSYKSNNKYNYLKSQKFNSIERTYDTHSLKTTTNKPILPIIKPSLFNLFTNNSINHNKDSSLLSPMTHLKTEENNINNRRRILFNGNKIDYNNIFWNNSNNSINNDFRYKLFIPRYKKYNISTLKGPFKLNI